MPLFQSKHQTLILQCYPSGRGFDKKPNSSELSYLLYYASTRRPKLEKVGRFLQKKNNSDIARGRTGNVPVTLDILDALMKKCPDDVNVFAENIVAVLDSVASSADLGLCQHAQPVYHTLCTTLNGELLTGDPTFVQAFVTMTKKFLKPTTPKHKANPVEWKTIALQSAASFGSSKFIQMGKGKEVLDDIVPLLISEIHKQYTEDNLLKKIASHTSEQHSLSRFNTAKSSKTVEAAKSSPTPISTDELALKALKALFHTTSTSQITWCTRAVAVYLTAPNEKSDADWASAVVEMITNWVPVQLRFVVLSIMFKLLDKSGDYNRQLVLVHIIGRLLGSSVSLVGLSVLDHLRQLIEIQIYLIVHSSSANELILAYSDAIGSLATHIYYQDQIVDMVVELLIKLKEWLVKPHKKYAIVMKVLLDNIRKVLITAHEHATVQRAHVPLELFSDTFTLLAFHDNDLSDDDSFSIQRTYTDLLTKDLELEYQDRDVTSADANNLITGSSKSVINQLYEQLEKCAELPTGTNFDPLLNLLSLLTNKFGINTMVNAIPFLLEWQLTEDSAHDSAAVLRDNFGFTIVYFAAKTLQYGDILDQVLSRIDYRKENGLWIISSTFPTQKSTTHPELILTKSQFERHLQENYPFRETILNTHYRYNNANTVQVSEAYEDDVHDVSMVSNSVSQTGSFANLHQPTAMFASDSNSIKSAPYSARSLMIGQLNVPKVQELRKAISGASLKVNGYGHVNGNGTAQSKQRTDARTLLQELSLSDDLEDQGSLTLRG